MRVIIVDDEAENRQMLVTLLKNYPEIELIGQAGSIGQAEAEIFSKKPDLVFLDISLPPDNVFDWLQSLERIDFLIIFVTAHHEYALKAFEYSAISYLLKPVDEELFQKAIQNALETLKKEQNFKIYKLFYTTFLTHKMPKYVSQLPKALM